MNEAWLENAKENFDEAIAEGRWELAKDIISDIEDRGFEREADQFNKELQAQLQKENKEETNG